MTLLSLESVTARHGLLTAVPEMSLKIAEGETLALVGANGAGKSTLLRTIAGAHPAAGGRILLDGTDITARPAHERVALGLALVPEGRRLFPGMTVAENLAVAARRAREGPWSLTRVYDTFTVLAGLRDRRASELSGGQQQLTAIARALLTNPRLLLIDEVSLGLSPVAVDAVYETLTTLDSRPTLLLVEQDLSRALDVAGRVICLLEGRIALSAATGDVTREQVTEAYFGLRGRRAAT
ncbi:branched-chain amino acid transport system ATP-binding protein [Actinoplanes campanulatus]|uniref:Branched-chain amino acid transport system ATP-binding protein n=1 Tax=Actinoplanes campanulatus TaxID=113559 RepID=A0A7W5AHV7_9ACTN|nr:ABC transporter ATP-binding protein [Actinoplanes campanulatus]MBB3096557.1 branched-chain amino acid transport system ATP-binding protein [Actinoplanes campanulatus]GGN17424.1 ABC transporter ATP-binding protein [Actinoplanes campanulatus]GID38624.1 ABC transporter ATP-binding protein [Actinoplanes campanulatus]